MRERCSEHTLTCETRCQIKAPAVPPYSKTAPASQPRPPSPVPRPQLVICLMACDSLLWLVHHPVLHDVSPPGRRCSLGETCGEALPRRGRPRRGRVCFDWRLFDGIGTT